MGRLLARALERLTGHAEKVLQLLGLPYRVLLLAGGTGGWVLRNPEPTAIEQQPTLQNFAQEAVQVHGAHAFFSKPFELNAARRHHIPRPKRRVTR